MSKKTNKTTMDNRMQWVLLFEENSQNKEKEAYFTDYEICSEVRIPGVLEYGDGSMLCGLLSEAHLLWYVSQPFLYGQDADRQFT